jgi:hypothetical protein
MCIELMVTTSNGGDCCLPCVTPKRGCLEHVLPAEPELKLVCIVRDVLRSNEDVVIGFTSGDSDERCDTP